MLILKLSGIQTKSHYYPFKNIYLYINNLYNNPLKVYFSSKKYLITIQTRPTQIVISIFLIENRFVTDF